MTTYQPGPGGSIVAAAAESNKNNTEVQQKRQTDIRAILLSAATIEMVFL